MNNNNYEKALEYYNNEEYEKAIEIFKVLAEEGESDSQFYLARMYNNGQGVDVDYAKALVWYTKAAEQGDADAQHNLAFMYQHGEGVEKDYTKAVYWYEKAAKQGNVLAQVKLAIRYEKGEGVEQNYSKALYWYEKAAQQGEKDCYQILALMYYKGKGTEQDYVKARFWFEKMAEQGDTDAHGIIADMYYFGKGVEVDYTKAFYWWSKAVEKGDIDSYLSLALMYDEGQGVEKNPVKALQLYEKAAEQGDAFAQFCLGEKYIRGEGVRRDYKKAVELFNAVATQKDGVKWAFYYLGDCYHNGYGVKADWKKAKEYYEEAIKRGYNCKFALDMIKADLKEFDGKTEMQNYAKQILSLGIHSAERVKKIEQDLQKEFGENWDKLKTEAQKSLVSGVFSYINFYELGEDTYKDLDFTPSITAMCKALEITLAEYFYKGYLKYLKENNISASIFDANSCFLKVDRNNDGLELSREYRDEEETKHFSLGAFYYIIDSKFEVMSSEQIAVREETTDSERSVSYRKKYRYAKEGDKSVKIEGERTLNKHVAEYADLIFTEESFSSANREKEIVNYLIDLSTDVFVIMQQRNPAAHGETMSCKHAEICGDYLIKVRKIICNFLEKVKDK